MLCYNYLKIENNRIRRYSPKSKLVEKLGLVRCCGHLVVEIGDSFDGHESFLVCSKCKDTYFLDIDIIREVMQDYIDNQDIQFY